MNGTNHSPHWPTAACSGCATAESRGQRSWAVGQKPSCCSGVTRSESSQLISYNNQTGIGLNGIDKRGIGHFITHTKSGKNNAKGERQAKALISERPPKAGAILHHQKHRRKSTKSWPILSLPAAAAACTTFSRHFAPPLALQPCQCVKLFAQFHGTAGKRQRGGGSHLPASGQPLQAIPPEIFDGDLRRHKVAKANQRLSPIPTPSHSAKQKPPKSIN